MNNSRLMVLGLLASQGPRHGHQIRRDAEQTKVAHWGGVSVGALYRELKKMEEEALVEPLRTEKIGNRPARTIYQITQEGLRELAILREQALRNLHLGPDTLGVGVTFDKAATNRQLSNDLNIRREAVLALLNCIRGEMKSGKELGWLEPRILAVMRRCEMLLETELAWHDQYAKLITDSPPNTTIIRNTNAQKSTARLATPDN